jgi:hypothetical protein
MSSGGPQAASVTEPADGRVPLIAGAPHLEVLTLPFQYFVSFWHQHCPVDGVAPFADDDGAPACVVGLCKLSYA